MSGNKFSGEFNEDAAGSGCYAASSEAVIQARTANDLKHLSLDVRSDAVSDLSAHHCRSKASTEKAVIAEYR